MWLSGYCRGRSSPRSEIKIYYVNVIVVEIAKNMNTMNLHRIRFIGQSCMEFYERIHKKLSIPTYTGSKPPPDINLYDKTGPVKLCCQNQPKNNNVSL